MDAVGCKVSEESQQAETSPQVEKPAEDSKAEDPKADNDAVLPDIEIPKILPDASKRRRSTLVQPDQAGCYLTYDQSKAKWVAVWSPTYVAEAVAILIPSVKVPQFKYTKKEKLVLQGELKASRDEKADYMMGICSFFKLVRDFKGQLTLLPSAEDHEFKTLTLLGLKGSEIVRFDKFDFTYPFLELDCVAVIPRGSVTFNCKQMEQAIFMGKAAKEGVAVTLKL